LKIIQVVRDTGCRSFDSADDHPVESGTSGMGSRCPPIDRGRGLSGAVRPTVIGERAAQVTYPSPQFGLSM
jgi:hypothetical protein